MEKEERRLIAALLDLNNIMDPVLWRSAQPKSSAESTKARKEGNDLYGNLPHDETTHADILRLYNRSCAFALPGSEEFVLALGNRSALLVHLGRYAEALRDLDHAMNFPLSDSNLTKYLCRKVECLAKLGMSEEAKITYEEATILLMGIDANADAKNNMFRKMKEAMSKLQAGEYERSRGKKKNQLPVPENQARSRECPDFTSDAVVIAKNDKVLRFGRHLRTSREIGPGQILNVSRPYASCPTESRLHANCSHCLRFVWAGLPCENCALAIYCSEDCRTRAFELYHDVECKVIDKIWKLYGSGNTVKLLSLRLLIVTFREVGCNLDELRDNLREIDACPDLRRKGFSENGTVFINNYRSVYSLSIHATKKTSAELNEISKNSAVLLYLLAQHTTIFRKYFDYEKKSLAKSENALFVARLISHYQHVVLINATKINDAYNITRKGWNWIGIDEEKCTGLYLNPFLSLLNHSCDPNVRRCEMEDGRTVLYSIQPINENEQIFDCYGPTYAETIKDMRQTVLFTRFYFTCECTACKNDWPLFKRMSSKNIKFRNVSPSVMEGITRSLLKCDTVSDSLRAGNFTFDWNNLEDLAYGIYLIVKFCKLPNWKLPTLIETFIAVFNDIYGYVIHMPKKC